MNRGYLIFLIYNRLIGKFSHANIFYMGLLLQTVFFCVFVFLRFYLHTIYFSVYSLCKQFNSKFSNPDPRQKKNGPSFRFARLAVWHALSWHKPHSWSKVTRRTLYLISILKTQRPIKKTTRSTRNKDINRRWLLRESQPDLLKRFVWI